MPMIKLTIIIISKTFLLSSKLTSPINPSKHAPPLGRLSLSDHVHPKDSQMSSFI